MRFLGLFLAITTSIGAQTLGQLRLVDFSPRTPATVVSNTSGALVITPGSFSLTSGQCVYIYQPVTLDQDRTLFSTHGNIGRGYFCVSVTDSSHWTITKEMYSNNASTGNGTTAGDKIVPLTTYYLRSGPRVALDGPIDEGAWSSSTAYQPLQMVQAPDSNYYVAIQDNTNQQPPNATYWRQVDHSKVGPGTYTASLRSTAVKNGYSIPETKSLFNTYFRTASGFDYNNTNGQNGSLIIPYLISTDDSTYLASAQRVATQAEDLANGSVECDINGTSITWCGRGSNIDYARLWTGEQAFFESMIDWTLSDAGRQSYANKVLNDNDTSHNGVDTSACTDMPKYQPDTSAADQLTCNNSVCTLASGSSIDFTALANFGVGSAIIGYPYNGATQEAMGRVISVDAPHQFTVAYVYGPWSRFNTGYPDVLGFAAGVTVLHTLTGSANPWFFTPPWDDSQHWCGVKWWVTHHGSGPNLIPDQVSHYPSDYNFTSSDFSRINNRTITAMQGQIAWGLTTADFDIRGVNMAEQAINYYMTQWLAQNAKSRWAAWNGHGNQYGPQRVSTIMSIIALMIKNSLTVTPPGVVTGGYLTNLARSMNYAVWNASPTYMHAYETGYGPCFNGDIQGCQELYTLIGLFAIARLYPSDTSTGWTWDYFHNRRGDYGLGVGAGGWTSLLFQPYGAAFDDPSATAVSISTNTLQQGLNDTDVQECMNAGLYCLPDAPHGTSVSTTGWSNTDTSVQVQGESLYLMGDDLESYAPSGAIAIYQNNGANSNALLGGNGLYFMSALSPNGGTYDASVPMLYSPTTGYQAPPYSSEYANAIQDRWAGSDPDGRADSTYMYLRVNYNPMVRQAPTYAAVQRSWFQVAGNVTREVLHFKNGSNNPNYLLVYDAFSGVAAGNRLESLWHLVTMPNKSTNFKAERHPEWVTTDYAHQAVSMVAPNTGTLNIKSFAVSGSSNTTVAMTDDSYNPPFFSGFPYQDHSIVTTSPPTWSGGVATVTFSGVPYNAYALPVGTPVQVQGITSTGPGSFNGTFNITSYSATGPTITYALATNPGTYVSATGSAQVSIAGWCTWVSAANPTASCAGNYPRTNSPFGSSSWPGTFRVTSCVSSDSSTCDTETAGEILTLLQPSSSSSATLPATNQPACSATGGSCFTFEIKDATYPGVAMMCRNGVLCSGMSSTTTHSGTANYVITGLAAGSYNVTRGGTLIASGTVPVGDTTLEFTSTSGVIAVTLTGAPTGFLTVSPGSLNFTISSNGTVSSAQNVSIGATGVTLDNWSATGSPAWATPSPTSGSSAGTMTVTPSATGVTAGNTYTGSITVPSSTSGISNSPQTVALTLTYYSAPTITTGSPLPSAVQSSAYSQTLSASGGLAPYSWTATANTCTGLTLSTAGLISGTPSGSGSCSITAQLTDSQPSPATTSKTFSLTINSSGSITLVGSPTSIALTCSVGGSSPQQLITFTSSGGTLTSWLAASANGNPWLQFSPSTGTAAANFNVSANCSSLLPGVYQDVIQISSPTSGVANSPLGIPITVTVVPTPLDVRLGGNSKFKGKVVIH